MHNYQEFCVNLFISYIFCHNREDVPFAFIMYLHTFDNLIIAVLIEYE